MSIGHETYRSTLTYAMAIVGGGDALAERLRVPVEKLMRWLHGAEPVPGEIFLRAVDVVANASERKTGPSIRGG